MQLAEGAADFFGVAEFPHPAANALHCGGNVSPDDKPERILSEDERAPTPKRVRSSARLSRGRQNAPRVVCGVLNVVTVCPNSRTKTNSNTQYGNTAITFRSSPRLLLSKQTKAVLLPSALQSKAYHICISKK